MNIPKFHRRRQKIAYGLSVAASLALIASYLYLQWRDFHGLNAAWLLGAALSWVPLLYFLPRLLRRDLKSFQILALWSPWHLFLGGLIALWQEAPQALWGWWLMLCALLLNLGCILHNFKPRRPRP